MDTWVVLVEAATGVPDALLDPALLQKLLARFADESPIGLYAPDRYVLQLWTPAEGPERALARTVERWRAAAKELGIHGFTLARAEVMTTAELDADIQAGTRETTDVPTEQRLHQALEAVHETTRALVRAESSTQATRAIVGLVYRLGGFIVLTGAKNPYELPFDLSFGEGPAISPAAFPHTSARTLLQELLPDVLADAWHILEPGSSGDGDGKVRRIVRQRADVTLRVDGALDPNPTRHR